MTVEAANASRICAANLTVPGKPSPTLPREVWMPAQSSIKPRQAKPISTKMGTRMLRPVPSSTMREIFSARVTEMAGRMIMIPPMVGVPILLAWWLSMSSARICLPIFRRCRISTKGPPQMTPSRKVAPPTLSARGN